jgi:hypothetical protein
VLLYDNRVRQGQSLPGSFADNFGREKRLEYFAPGFFGDSQIPFFPNYHAR